MVLEQIGTDHVQRLLERSGAVRTCLAQALATDPDRADLAVTARELCEGAGQLWLVVDRSLAAGDSRPELRAVVLTEILRASSGMRFCRITFCAGQGMRDWIHLLDRIEAWAYEPEQGCAEI